MTLDEALGLAAWAWCKKTTNHKVMDVALAEEFAKILKDRVDSVEAHMEVWKDIAALHTKNECYYRDLVVKIGEMLGEVAYLSDDGSKQQDVLCAKVPELVAQLIKSRSLPRGGFF